MCPACGGSCGAVSRRGKPARELNPAWRGTHYYNDPVFLCEQCLEEATRIPVQKAGQPEDQTQYRDDDSFPVATKAEAGHGAVEKSLRGNGERVLVVDDEAPVAIVISKTLARLGYDVSTFTNPVEALRAVEKLPGRFDLLFTDFNMPQMTGTELAKRVRQLRPELPVILCTGHRGLIDEAERERLGLRLVIDKPFTSEALARALRQALSP